MTKLKGAEKASMNKKKPGATKAPDVFKKHNLDHKLTGEPDFTFEVPDVIMEKYKSFNKELEDAQKVAQNVQNSAVIVRKDLDLANARLQGLQIQSNSNQMQLNALDGQRMSLIQGFALSKDVDIKTDWIKIDEKEGIAKVYKNALKEYEENIKAEQVEQEKAELEKTVEYWKKKYEDLEMEIKEKPGKAPKEEAEPKILPITEKPADKSEDSDKK